MRKAILICSLIIYIVAFQVAAKSVTPYKGSRIFWDTSSRVEIFSNGNYARMIQLQDGRLMAVAESLGGISIAISTNMGQSWNSPIRIVDNPDNTKWLYAVPDLIQLSDGTILVGFNPRPTTPYSTDRKFGIRVVRSTDNGSTWSAPIFVFDARHEFTSGCWEPAFLELPSGEVHCYFANEEPFWDESLSSRNDQEIAVCSSNDNGLTWGSSRRVSYRSGARDGMPAPILLENNNEIVVIIEDNGWPGRGNFAATTVRTSIDDNWSTWVNASSSSRSMIFERTPSTSIYSAAPYIRMLPWGETVASYQGNENRPSSDLEYADQYILVGDEKARNFKAKSAPFCQPATNRAIWNSVSVIDTGVVVAVASTGVPYGSNKVEMIKGYPIRQATAKYGTITPDGVYSSSEMWTDASRAQLIFGNVIKQKTTVDFLYDDKYLYFTARVADRTNVSSTTDNDGVLLLIDANNVSSETPQQGMYSLFFNRDGSVQMKRGNLDAWSVVQEPIEKGLIYGLDARSTSYLIEAAIPWSLIGKDAPSFNRMAIGIEIVNKDIDNSKVVEIIDDMDKNASWTWLDFRLAPKEDTSIKCNNQSEKQVVTIVKDGVLYLNSDVNILKCSIFSIAGQLLCAKVNSSKELQLAINYSGFGIINVLLADKSSVSKRVFF